MSENSISKKTLVIFDLDNTLLEGESQRYFLTYLFQLGMLKLTTYVRILFWFFRYKLNFAVNPREPLELALTKFIGWEIGKTDAVAKNFVSEILVSKFYPKMLEVLAHELRDADVLLLSNSIEPIVKAVAAKFKIPRYICTELEIQCAKLTGRIKGEIVYGRNKANRTAAFANQFGYDLKLAKAYADHRSDLELLKSVGYPIVINPDKILLSTAKENHWEILNCRN